MARIRTIKPSAFRHGELYDAEIQSKLPLRWAYAGLWTVADRRGRFRWRVRELKLDVLPHDECDFSRVLDALTTRGFIVRYACDGDEFGWIPSFQRHQMVNNKELESGLPPHPEDPDQRTTYTRGSRVYDACPTPANLEKAEQEQEQEGNRKGSIRSVRDRFDLFWSSYPRKVGKGAAEKAWRTLKPTAETAEAMLDAIARQRQSRQWRESGGQYIPHPATWLRQRRWEDEQAEPAPVSTASEAWAGPWCRHERKCGTREHHEALLARGVLELPEDGA